jgi:hypothetical protein
MEPRGREEEKKRGREAQIACMSTECRERKKRKRTTY